MSWVTKRIVLASSLLEAQELVLEALADDRVDGAEGLVHEHQRRVRGEGPRHADALALATRELAGIAVAVPGRIEADQGQQLVDAVTNSAAFPAQQARDDRHVVADRQVRQQAHLLDDVADPPPQLDRVPFGGRPCRRSGSGRRSARSAG